MKVLVTGGAGFIGSHFVRYVLRERPTWQLVNLDKLTYAGNLENLHDVLAHPCYQFVPGDIADHELVAKLFREERFEALVNFAAESHVDRSILDATPFTATNVRGTQVLLEVARHHSISRFVQISTDEVYGSVPVGRCTEDAPLRPSSPYAASKTAADLFCQAYATTYGLPVIITRGANNYGPCQFPEKLIPLMILNAMEGKMLPLYGHGEQMREWLYVEDHCRALVAVVERGRVGAIYNISSEEARQNRDVVALICELMARRLNRPIEALTCLITSVKDRPGHDFRYSLDAARTRAELSWRPMTAFTEGLEKTLDWYLEHQDWVARVRSGEYREYYARIYERGWQ